jgi:HAD superfamily hydrolase (TIGR01509 family)
MTAFYFDVGGVLISDKFAPSNALAVFRELAQRHSFAPEAAYAAYTRLQPSLDLGEISLAYLCAEMGIEQEAFERDWLAMHPINGAVVSLMQRLALRGHAIGLATNFCRRLLDLLIGQAAGLPQMAVCCSSDIGIVKPSVGFFDRAAKMVNEKEIVFVDDRAVNVEAARGSGWTAFLAENGWQKRLERLYLTDDPGAQVLGAPLS